MFLKSPSLIVRPVFKNIAVTFVQSGDNCMVVPTLKTEDAKKKFPKGVDIKAVPSGKEYLRFTPDPSK